MSQTKISSDEDTMLDHYDFDYSKAIRGRTAATLAKMGYPVMVILRPEVAEVFKDAESVNVPSSTPPVNVTKTRYSVR